MGKNYYSTFVVSEDILPHASQDELLAITRIFDATAAVPQNCTVLTAKICNAGGHAVGNWLRNQGVPYSELLHDVANAMKVKNVKPLRSLTSTGLTISEMDERALDPAISVDVTCTWKQPIDDYLLRLEREIAGKFIGDAYARMTPEQREKIDRKVQEIAGTNSNISLRGLTTSAAVVLIANAGGFATYTLMSTVISTLTMGMASFGVYTAAASVVHLLIGPAGWAALGITAAYQIGGPNKQQCVKAVLALAMIRNRDHLEIQ